jgi:hypothetical protein
LKKRDKYYAENTFIDHFDLVVDDREIEQSLTYYEMILRSQKNDLGVLYLEDCINYGNSLHSFAKYNNISYYKAVKVKEKVIKEIKKRY